MMTKQKTQQRRSRSNSNDRRNITVGRDGVWGLTVFIRRHPVTGKQLFKYETVHGTLADAQARRDEIEKGVRDGRFDRDSHPFGDVLDEWLLHVRSQRREETIIDGYKRQIERDVRPALGQ